MKILPLAMAFAVAISGCAGPRFVGRQDLTVTEGSALPPPAQTDLAPPGRPTSIGPLDRISIEVFGVPDLSRQVQIDASGHVSVPLVGTLEASGQTTQQLARTIEDRLRGSYVRNPQVTVNVTEAVSQAVTVDGEVRTPGIYPVVPNMTLMRTIARAQGVTEFARQNHVVIFRRVDNRDMAALYDLRAIRLGMYGDPNVYANDVVVVGDSQARRIFRDVLQASGVITAPLIAVLQQSSN